MALVALFGVGRDGEADDRAQPTRIIVDAKNLACRQALGEPAKIALGFIGPIGGKGARFVGQPGKANVAKRRRIGGRQQPDGQVSRTC